MISFDFHSKCCGCGACAEVCPQHCISMEPDEWGFAMPKVDKSSCIDCKLCDHVCSVLNVRRGESHVDLYWGYNVNNEERKLCSSGGVFFLIAEEILSQKGVVVGAQFDENLKLHHVIAEDRDSVMPLLKSKYIQSNMDGVYRELLKWLKSGRKVLFCGTPCQVNAIQNFVSSHLQEFLYCIDFVCHGVPSQKMFDDYIQFYEKRNNRKVFHYTFRYKDERVKSPHCYNIEYMSDGGSRNRETGVGGKEPFYRAYREYFMFREACYKCPFARPNRTSDVTISDCWGLEKVENNIHIQDLYQGYSMFQVNTNKGKQLFRGLFNNKKLYYKEFPMTVAIKSNPAYSRPSKKPDVHYIFFFAYKFLPYGWVNKMFFGEKICMTIRILAKLVGIFK